MFSVYIIFSAKADQYYKGFSEDPIKRLQAHNAGECTSTSNKGPWILVYTKSFETKREALIEEKRLKRLNRASILKIIELNADQSSRS